jgi:hypothetical protein
MKHALTFGCVFDRVEIVRGLDLQKEPAGPLGRRLWFIDFVELEGPAGVWDGIMTGLDLGP